MEDRSDNTLAYLIGGLIIALGLLAFLFYDKPGPRPIQQACDDGHVLIQGDAGLVCVLGYVPRRAVLRPEGTY